MQWPPCDTQLPLTLLGSAHLMLHFQAPLRRSQSLALELALHST
jgi:hypothetical protein